MADDQHRVELLLQQAQQRISPIPLQIPRSLTLLSRYRQAG
jgi:hypothetical protein